MKKTIRGSGAEEKGVPKSNKVHPRSNTHKRQPDAVAGSSLPWRNLK